MARFESLRDRLPALYRPDADETVHPLLPLGRDDLADVVGDAGAIRFTSTARNGALIVTAGGPRPVRALRLKPGRAPGTGYALEVRGLVGESPSPKPLAVLPLLDGLAAVAGADLPETFALQLKQRGLLTLHLMAVAGRLE